MELIITTQFIQTLTGKNAAALFHHFLFFLVSEEPPEVVVWGGGGSVGGGRDLEGHYQLLQSPKIHELFLIDQNHKSSLVFIRHDGLLSMQSFTPSWAFQILALK